MKLTHRSEFTEVRQESLHFDSIMHPARYESISATWANVTYARKSYLLWSHAYFGSCQTIYSLVHTCEARVESEADAEAEASKCECMWGKRSKSNASETRVSKLCDTLNHLLYMLHPYFIIFLVWSTVVDKEELLTYAVYSCFLYRLTRRYPVLCDQNHHTFKDQNKMTLACKRSRLPWL